METQKSSSIFAKCTQNERFAIMKALNFIQEISLKSESMRTCLDKQREMVALFGACLTEEAKYHKIIELGRQLAPYAAQYRTSHYIVKGCQSVMYLHSELCGDRVVFTVGSEALISAGLAAILINVYSGETAETILKCPPQYLEQLGVQASLTPSRANGLYSIHLRMKQDALKLFMEASK